MTTVWVGVPPWQNGNLHIISYNPTTSWNGRWKISKITNCLEIFQHHDFDSWIAIVGLSRIAWHWKMGVPCLQACSDTLVTVRHCKTQNEIGTLWKLMRAVLAHQVEVVSKRHSHTVWQDFVTLWGRIGQIGLSDVGSPKAIWKWGTVYYFQLGEWGSKPPSKME